MMNKHDLKEFLSIYPKLRGAILAGEKETVIVRYGRKKCVAVPPWAMEVEKSLREIAAHNDTVIAQIIDNLYLKGYNDCTTFSRLPVSESTFYRLKRKIEDRVFEMCIFFGHVSKAEILSIAL